MDTDPQASAVTGFSYTYTLSWERQSHKEETWKMELLPERLNYPVRCVDHSRPNTLNYYGIVFGNKRE